MKKLAVVVAAVLALGACSVETKDGTISTSPTATTAPSPAVTVTEAAKPAVTVTKAPAAPVAPPKEDKEALTRAALEMTWSAESAEDQASMCVGWNLAPDTMLESFLEGAGDQFHVPTVKKFFDEQCN